MDHAQQCHSRRTDPLCRGLLTSYLDTYTRYLMGRGYARRTIDGYHAVFRAFFHSGCAISACTELPIGHVRLSGRYQGQNGLKMLAFRHEPYVRSPP
jgi:hypothetical protein